MFSSSIFTDAEINANTFFKTPFSSLIRPKQLVEYTVMDIEPISDHERRTFSGQGAISKKVMIVMNYLYVESSSLIQHGLADAWVVKSSELGMNEDTTHVRTHLGHLLSPGDTVLG